jgi:hypothetical protein
MTYLHIVPRCIIYVMIYILTSHQKKHITNTWREITIISSEFLRRGSAAARLPGLWVRILRGHRYMFLVSVVCCQVQVSASG